MMDKKIGLGRGLVLIGFLALGLFVYTVIKIVNDLNHTGLLTISSSPGTRISIGQEGKEYAPINSKGVRLSPGEYDVLASENGYQNMSRVDIVAGQTFQLQISLPGAAAKKSSSGLFDQLPFLGPASQYLITRLNDVTATGSGPAILITSSDMTSRQKALQWITSQGYNPSDYTIKYEVSALANYHFINGLR